MIKFYFPDSVDVINPNYDFLKEEHENKRLRVHSEAYPHEIYDHPPYDGMLVSLAVYKQRYTLSQRQRVWRQGIRKFLRLDKTSKKLKLKVIGDCGAFSYRQSEIPPYTVSEVVEFYDQLGFDFGISLDHVIMHYQEDDDFNLNLFPNESEQSLELECKNRQQTTLELASAFKKCVENGQSNFKPMGVAQGWSPSSYAESVKSLQKIGFDYIAIGGLIPLKTLQIERCLAKIQEIRFKTTKLHLLGISRITDLANLDKYGVVSVDSTAPFVQSFKSDLNNYHTREGNFIALRVPQIGENAKIKARILSGEIEQEQARKLELSCLDQLRKYDEGKLKADKILQSLCEYETLITNKRPKNKDLYFHTLVKKPWKKCKCPICTKLGVQVIIFRGAERNRNRGFHNLYNYYSAIKENKPTSK
ncbi:tRNA-guanine transglycosylase DpdA [Verrucomicrobia bacterium]|nr:tRNA-guanine transglycosylase DpdA [Verrucomicrobiota bacterium]